MYRAMVLGFHSIAAVNDEAGDEVDRRVLRLRPARIAGALGPLERGDDARRVERLEDVVGGLDVEGAQRVVIPRRREDDDRTPLRLLQHVERGLRRELDVEKGDEIGR